MLDETARRVPWNRLGFDVTCVTSRPKPNLSQPQAARHHELNLRLRQGEKRKFCRQAQTDTERQVTLSGDEVIGNIIENNMALIPTAVSPHWPNRASL